MLRLASLADRFRWPIVAAWIVVLALGGLASANLASLLSNRYEIPDTESTTALDVLQRDFGQRGDSALVLVADAGGEPTRAQVAAVGRAAEAVARAVGDAQPTAVQTAGPLAYVTIVSGEEPVAVQARLAAARAAITPVPDARVYLTGQAAINRDLQPIVDGDLLRGELIAIPIAFAVLLFIFGTLISTFVPLLFALATVPTTLGIVWIAAHWLNMPIYVTNLVTLIGIGIAVDYSLLVVYRFREEMHRIQTAKLPPEGGDVRRVPLDRDEIRAALRPTMEFAGHAVVFSGLTVAVGLAGLLLLPLPFIQAIGLGGLMIPLISILAAVTLLPAVLSILGTWLARVRVVPTRVLEARMDSTKGFWVSLSTAIMRRPWPFLLAGSALLLALALPTLRISLTPGSNTGLPTTVESVEGLQVLERAVGAGTLAPLQVVVDTGRAGGVWAADEQAAIGRLATGLRSDAAIGERPAAVAAVTDLLAEGDTKRARAAARKAGLVDPSGRYALVLGAQLDAYGSEPAQELARRARAEIVPAARFPAGTTVLVGGGPAAGIDFIDAVYRSFPYLIVAVLGLSFILLMRAFRSLLLPLKAVILNVLSVAAAYGVLVLVFQDGWGEWAGFTATGQVEAWIPVFLFAMLFGLSMDYEVFLVSRMRELYDRGASNGEAVAQGLERTGRIVSAAAIILVAAFAGLMLGSIAALQQFGLGLAAGILIDATLIRMLLVPSYMQIAGNLNWYLPDPLARILRVAPSPLRRG